MSKCSFVAIDFETATTSRFPCQMGIVVVRGGQIVEKKEYLIKPPENKYSRNCIWVHGITPDKTKDCQEFFELWPEIREYLRCEVIVAHNMDFDISVLETVLRYYKLDFPPITSLTCTCKLYNGNKLSSVIAALGMDLINHHDALFDAEMCAKIFLAYLIDEVKPDELTYPGQEKKQDKRRGNSSRNQIVMDEDELAKVKRVTDEEFETILSPSIFESRRVINTGNLLCMSRNELKQLVIDAGGKYASSISKSIDIVILGDNPGPKKIETIIELQSSGLDIICIDESHLEKYLTLIEYGTEN